jgi:PIN domain nuclease of toxin-antitoxin system
MSIKVSIGKLELQRPFSELMAVLIDANGFEILPIDYGHTVTVSSLPFHHKDPFDRLLIAQSLTDDLPIVGADAVFDPYGVKRLW